MFFLLSISKRREALAQFEATVLEDPLNQNVRVGLTLAQIDDLAAERMTLRILDTEPAAWRAHAWLAPYYQRQGDLEKALEYAERCHTLVPGHHGATGSLAGILTLLGDQEKAAELLKELGTGRAPGEPARLVCTLQGAR